MFFFKKKTQSPIQPDAKDIAQEFGNLAIASVSDILGPEHVRIVLQKEFDPKDISIDRKGRLICGLGSDHDTHVKKILSLLAQELVASFGRDFTETKIAYIWYSFKAKYKKEAALLAKTITLIPEGYLEEEKIRFLSKEALENAYRNKQRN